MTTPIYGIPYPALGSNADGPAAFQAQATRVEREMTVLRRTDSTAQAPGFPVGPNQGGDVVTWSIPLVVIGWIEVEVDLGIQSYNPNTVDAWAGQVAVVLDGVTIVSKRFHNNGMVASMDKTVSCRRAVTAAQSSVNIVVHVSVDAPAAQPVIVAYLDISAWQFGAPSTG